MNKENFVIAIDFESTKYLNIVNKIINELINENNWNKSYEKMMQFKFFTPMDIYCALFTCNGDAEETYKILDSVKIEIEKNLIELNIEQSFEQIVAMTKHLIQPQTLLDVLVVYQGKVKPAFQCIKITYEERDNEEKLYKENRNVLKSLIKYCHFVSNFLFGQLSYKFKKNPQRIIEFVQETGGENNYKTFNDNFDNFERIQKRKQYIPIVETPKINQLQLITTPQIVPELPPFDIPNLNPIVIHTQTDTTLPEAEDKSVPEVIPEDKSVPEAISEDKSEAISGKSVPVVISTQTEETNLPKVISTQTQVGLFTLFNSTVPQVAGQTNLPIVDAANSINNQILNLFSNQSDIQETNEFTLEAEILKKQRKVNKKILFDDNNELNKALNKLYALLKKIKDEFTPLSSLKRRVKKNQSIFQKQEYFNTRSRSISSERPSDSDDETYCHKKHYFCYHSQHQKPQKTTTKQEEEEKYFSLFEQNRHLLKGSLFHNYSENQTDTQIHKYNDIELILRDPINNQLV